MDSSTLLLAIIPEETVLDILEEAIKEHKILNTSKSREELKTILMMSALKFTVAESMESVLEFEKEADKIKAGMNLLTPREG